MKLFSIYMLFALIGLNTVLRANDPVSWIPFNGEKADDSQNIFFDEAGNLQYSEYNSELYLWRMRSNDLKGSDTLMIGSGLNGGVKIVSKGNYRYAISQSGQVYKYSFEEAWWNELVLPTTDYRANDIQICGSTIFLFPKYGAIYTSDNGGYNWQLHTNASFPAETYNSFTFKDTLFVIKSKTLYRSGDCGNTWSNANLPESSIIIAEYHIANSDNLYVSDESNNIFRVTGNSFQFISKFPGKIYGLLSSTDSSLIISSIDGIYEYSYGLNNYRKIFSYVNTFDNSEYNVLKSRAIALSNQLCFILPNNDIVYSENSGQNWRYVRINLSKSKIDKVASGNNQLLALSNGRFYYSDLKSKIWFETDSIIPTSTLPEIQYSTLHNTFVICKQNELLKFDAEALAWSKINLPIELENLNLISLVIVDENNMMLLTNGGLYSSANPFTDWNIVNPNINTGKLKVSYDFVYWMREGIASEIDLDGNMLNTISLLNNYNARINDLLFHDNNLFIASDKGLFIYNAASLPAYRKIVNGIATKNILQLAKLDTLIICRDYESNTYISDKDYSKFVISHNESSRFAINDMAVLPQNRVYLSTSNNGILTNSLLNHDAINNADYWIDNNDYFEHSNSNGNIVDMSSADDSQKVFRIANENDNYLFSSIDLINGKVADKFSISDLTALPYSANNTIESLDLSNSNDYLAVSLRRNSQIASNDSLIIIDINSKASSSKFALLPDELPQNSKLISNNLLFLSNSNNLISAISYSLDSELGETIYNSKIFLNQLNTGLNRVFTELPIDSKSGSGRITALAKSDKYTAIGIVDNNSNAKVILTDANGVIFKTLNLTNNVNKIDKIVMNKSNSALLVSISLLGGNPSDFNEAIVSCNISNGKTKTMSGVKVFDLALSNDSLSAVAVIKSNNSGNEVSKILQIDFHLLSVFSEINLSNDFAGTLAQDRKNDRIVVGSSNGIVRAFVNNRPVDSLRAEFSSDAQFAVSSTPISFYNLSNGYPDVFEWNFGDGKKSYESNPVHTYSNPGLYHVTLKVWKNGAISTITKNEYIKIYANSEVDFKSDKQDGFAPLTVSFTELSAGELISRNWDFGDGTFSQEANPTHIYTNPGKYSVKLISDNGIKVDTIIKPNYINVDSIPKVYEVDFAADAISGTAPFDVKFTPITNPSSTSWLWDFGDGTTSTAQSPTHTYIDYGNYTVKLTAGKEHLQGKVTKVSYIQVNRGNMHGLKIVREYEEQYYLGKGNKRGLSAIQTKDKNIVFDIAVDSNNLKYSEIGLLNTDKQVIDLLRKPEFTNNSNDRLAIPFVYSGFTMLNTTKSNDYTNVLVYRLDLLGNIQYQFTARRNQNTYPIASLSDGSDYLVASIANDSILVLNKFNPDNQFLFDKEITDNYYFNKAFVKLLVHSNNYYIILKDNDNRIAQLLTLDKNGNLQTKVNLFEKAYYHISDAYFDSNNNLIIGGMYRFSIDLSPVYSYISKFDLSGNQIKTTQISNGFELNSIEEVIDKYGSKKYIAAGSIEGNVGFVSLKDDMEIFDRVKFDNRIGKFNDILKLNTGELVMTGQVLNAKDKYNFYAVHFSSDNSYAGVIDDNSLDMLEIIPNPSDGRIKLSIDDNYDLVKVYNQEGQCVYQKQLSIANNIELNLTGLNNGVYYLELSNQRNRKIGKLIISK